MGSCGPGKGSGSCRPTPRVPRSGYDRPVRRTLPTLIAAALMVALVGLAIASNRSSTRATGAVLSSPVTELPAAPRTSAVADTVGEPSGRVLAEMTRRLGTPRGVAFSHRRRAAQYRRLQARI